MSLVLNLELNLDLDLGLVLCQLEIFPGHLDPHQQIKLLGRRVMSTLIIMTQLQSSRKHKKKNSKDRRDTGGSYEQKAEELQIHAENALKQQECILF